MATYTGLDGDACTPFSISGGIGAGACGFSDADLQLDSTNRMDFQIGGIDVLSIFNTDFTNPAAADADGSQVNIIGQAGGVASAPCGGNDGGFLTVQSGDGSNAGSSGGLSGGSGGLMFYQTGDGGTGGATCACMDNAGAGGVSGAICIFTGQAGDGGAATGACSDGGAGACTGAIAIVTQTAGDGGASTLAGGGNGGFGGDVTIRSGQGGRGGTGVGCSCGGIGGDGGDICILTGRGGVCRCCGGAGESGTISIKPGNVCGIVLARTACNVLEIGLFGATPVAQPTHVTDVPVGGCAVAACNATAINLILGQLAALGLQACV